MKTKIKRMSKRTLAMLLGVLMLVTSIGLGTIITASAASSKVYFYNSSSWSNPYVWAWNGNTNYTGGSWPGKSMSAVSGYDGLYSFTLDTNANNILFSDNGDNTKRKEINNISSSTWSNKVYDLSSNTWKSVSELYKTTTVYVKNGLKINGNGNSITHGYIYNSENSPLEDWPGSLLSNWDTTSVPGYSGKTFTKPWNSFYLILNNGQGGNGNQTANMDSGLSTGSTYYITGIENNKPVSTTTAPEQLYSVNVTAGTGGKIKVGSATASASQTANVGATTTAKVTAVPNTGYSFDKWTVSSGVTGVTNNSTENPLTAVGATAAGTLTANFKKNTYTITYPSASDYYTVSKIGTETVAYQAAGTEFTVTSNNTNKYEITKVYYTVEGSSTQHELTATGGKYKIDSMPAGNVTIAVDVTNLYTVTFASNNTTLGTVTATSGGTTITSPTNVQQGKKLVFTATAKSDGIFKGWYNNAEGTGTALGTDSPYTINSANDDVTVYGVFTEAVTATATTKGDGSGTVKINNGNSPKTVAKGSNVEFKATPSANYTFCGWYSDAACTTPVSYDATYTLNNIQSATTLYANFEPEKFYLSGYLRERNWQSSGAKDKKEGWELTQDSTNKNLFKLSIDVTGEQYVVVNTGDLDKIYLASSQNAASGTAANAAQNYIYYNNMSDNNYRWKIDGDKWPFSQHIDVVWDAVAKKLSWTISDVDLANHTYIYVKKEDSVKKAYLWSDDNKLFGNYPGRELSGFPTISKNGNEYYIIDISKDDLPANATTFNIKVNDGGNNGTDVTNLELGHSYAIEYNNSNKTDADSWNPISSSDKYYLAGEYSDGSVQFFGTAWSTNTLELTKNGSVYERTFTNNIPAGTIKFKVVKNGDWNEGSWPDENQTYVIQPNATSVKFSFNPTTGKITVTQTNSGSGESSGEWVAGDKYTSQGEVNSSRKVDDVPDIGSTNEYSFVWSDNDNGPGKSGKTAINAVKNSNGGYWADLTEQAKQNSNFFFALANTQSNPSNSNIVGNKNEQINCVKKNSGESVTMYTSSGAQAIVVEMKERSEVSGSAHFVLLRGVDWTKVTNVGVMAYKNNDGYVDYQFYFKEKGTTPIVEAQVVDIVAKNGTLRDSTFNRFTNLANTDFVDYFSYEETDAEGVTTTYNSITDYNNAHSNKQIVIENDINYGGSTYAKMTNVPVGAKIKLKTTLSSDANKEGSFDGKAFKDTHYLKGYSFNGMTYEIHEPNTTGVYEETWTVRAVNTTYTDKNDVLQQATTNGNTVEVTPVYYMKDTTNVKTFYIDGYDGEVQEAWGNMLTVYPYYEGISNSGNAFGGYPGQPMLFWGGKYQMEIPLTVDGTATGASVKGLTLHNGYWDLLHRSIDIRCNTRNHAQTYDYDDFYKLYKEKDPDTIIFDFKYRTKTDNYGDGYDYTRYNFAGSAAKSATDFVNENGVELVTDYFGRQVDAFGNLIKDAEKSDWDTTQDQDKELLFVSTGYKDTYVGEYATLWAVYAPETDMKGGDTSNKFIGYISSSMLYLKDFDRVKQYAGGTLETNGRMSWSEFKSTYNHLKTYYTGVPALISYEKEIWNDSKDKANRSDGKWYYSNKSDKIQASIKIQYGPYSLIEAPDHSVSSDAWKDDPFDATQTGVGGQKNIGTNTNCSAYFTNTSPNLLGKVESGEQFADSTKTFTFQAVPSGSYMFAGWVRYSNGKYYEITENELGSSSMSANDVYIARFVTAKTGTLTVQHVVEQTDTFTGTGTPSLTVTVKNNGTNVTGSPFTVSDGSKIDISKWIDIRNKDYTIDITLQTTPTNESFMKEIVSSSGNFAASPNKWNTDKTATDSSNADTGAQTTTVAQFTVGEILDSGVTSLRYVSHLMKPKYTYNYSIVYTYTSRFWGEQSYTVTGTFEDDSDFAANATGSKTSAKLNTDFIINKTPYEKNFRQTINWNYTSSAVGKAKAMENEAAIPDGTNTYKMTAHVYSANDDSKKVKAEIFLPYNLNDFSEDTGYTAKGMDVYSAATDGSKTGQTAVVYDDTVEPVSLETEAYKLFTYAGEKVSGGNDVIPSSLKLVEAAPYVLCKSYDSATGKYTPVDFHTHRASTKRYMTGNSFKVGNVTYYLNQFPEGVTEDETHKVINASNVANYTVTFTKPGNDYQTTYKYAVQGEEDNHRVIYFFAYNMNAQEQMVDNEGNETTTPVFNGQYIIYREYDEVDGVVQGDYQKKYFTRWDITNSKGEFVASCYSRKFNYTGYENYVVRAIYESDVEQEFYNEGSEGTSASITYLGDTRNQWNNGALGEYATVTKKSDGNTAGDKLLHDFAITYYYNGKEIQAIQSTDKVIKVGMMIEQLGKLETIGGEKVYDSSYYANEYKGNNTSATLKNCLENGLNPKNTTGFTTINSKIGANVANFGTQFGTAANTATAKMNFNSVIDNFNRLQWFYTFNNTKTNGVIGETNNANYAYRAWSYIIVDGVATVSSTPAYFTLYDSAHR